jgi:hypothetical protein
MYLNNRMQTPSLFHLFEMMSMHMMTLLQMRVSIQRTQMIQIQIQYMSDPKSVQLDAESEHPDAVAEPEQRPKWAQTTLQDVGDLVGDPDDTRRTQYDFEVPPIALTSTKPFPPMHIFLGQSSDPQYYGEADGNPFWESCHVGGVQLNPREPDLGSGSPSLWEETCQMQMGLQDQEHIGWIDQQIQSQSFSKFMVLTMMRPSLQ